MRLALKRFKIFMVITGSKDREFCAYRGMYSGSFLNVAKKKKQPTVYIQHCFLFNGIMQKIILLSHFIFR